MNGVENCCTLQDADILCVDVLGLSETNVNWNNPHERNKWNRMIQRMWPKGKILTASIKDGDWTSTYTPGGVSMTIRGRYASMISASRSDEMGRWVWATLGSGKDKVTLITYYRPCEDNVNSAGEGSSWMQ